MERKNLDYFSPRIYRCDQKLVVTMYTMHSQVDRSCRGASETRDATRIRPRVPKNR